MSLRKQLERIANKINYESKIIINTDIAEEVVSMAKKNVQTVVYDVYEPMMYARTGQLKDDWKITPTEYGVLIGSDRTDRDRQVSYIVESGVGYRYLDLGARPFMETTREQIQNSDRLESIFTKSLSKELGLKVKRR